MAPPTFLRLVSGQLTLVSAVAVGGGGSAEAIPSLDAAGLIPVDMLPAEALDGAEEEIVVLTETVAAGDLINVYNSSGLKGRRADASGPTPLYAFGIAKEAGDSTDSIPVQTGVVSFTTASPHGLTLMAPLYLSTTAGALTATPPSLSGQLVQEVAYAVGASKIVFRFFGRGILLAT